MIRYRISRTQVKQSKLKLSLTITLKIQREYYRRRRRSMPPAVLAKQLAGAILMLLPARWILKLFCLITYRRSDDPK